MNFSRGARAASLAVAVLVVVSFSAFGTAGAVNSSHANATGSSVTSKSATTPGLRYATTLLAKLPIPPRASRLISPLEPLHPVTGSPDFAHLVSVTRYYELPASIEVDGFAQSHFPKGEQQGAGSTFDGGYHTSDTFSPLSWCTNRHAAYCAVTYSARTVTSTQQELRVDVSVVWLAIHVGRLPSNGVVTVTGYRSLSLAFGSRGALSVALSSSQARQLRHDIAQLRTSPGGTCMEDVTLYKVSVSTKKSGAPFWSATADECPGALVITSREGRVRLNDRSCPLDTLVSTYFPGHEAKGTTSVLKECLVSG